MLESVSKEYFKKYTVQNVVPLNQTPGMHRANTVGNERSKHWVFQLNQP